MTIVPNLWTVMDVGNLPDIFKGQFCNRARLYTNNSLQLNFIYFFMSLIFILFSVNMFNFMDQNLLR